MGAAIIGLVGVVVGGILTGLVQAITAWRRERAELRAAVRLLHLELLGAQSILSTSLASDDAGRLKGAISIERWSQFSGLIAKKAHETLWRHLAAAYGNLAVLRADAEFMERRKLLPNEREAIEEFLALVNTAEEALRNEALAGQVP